jgi:hybrid cluster-associated redox disulfide protein
MSKRKRLRDGEAATEGLGEASRFHRGMLVADAVNVDPRVQDVLTEYGLPCSSCIVAWHETLADGCAPLGLSVDEVVARLNALG